MAADFSREYGVVMQLTIKELQAMGAIWIDRDGNDALDCRHEIKIAPLAPGGVALVHCVKCLKTAEQIRGENRA